VGRVGPWNPGGWPTAETGWLIAREHWGKGYAAEAARATMDYMRDAHDWTHTAHMIAPDNDKSRRVAQKLGSTLENPAVELPINGQLFISEQWGQPL
jgi:RimJ/RimL family protein N-acetyltransferase